MYFESYDICWKLRIEFFIQSKSLNKGGLLRIMAFQVLKDDCIISKIYEV